MSKKFNRFVSGLICVCMLFGMQGMLGVSASTDYAFKNVLVGEYSSAGTSLIIGWRNPVADTITNVTLYDITDGTETVIKNDFEVTGGLTIEHEITDLTIGMSRTYKVKATFSDADPVEYIVSGCPKSTSKTVNTWFHTADSTNAKGFVVNVEKGYTTPPFLLNIDNTVGYGDSNSSLHIAVSKPESATYSSVMYYYDKSLISEDSTTLKLKFYAKGKDVSGVVLAPMSSGTFLFSKGAEWSNDEWTLIEKTMKVNSSGWIKLGFSQTIEDLWIDNLELHEIKSNGTEGEVNLITNGDFETMEAAPVAVTGGMAESFDGGLKLSWTDTVASSYNVYDASGLQVARLCGETDEVYLNGLTNDVEYNYIVKPVSYFGTEGAGTIIKGTPKAAEVVKEYPQYEFKNVIIAARQASTGQVRIGWHNPTATTTSKVSLYYKTSASSDWSLVTDALPTLSGKVCEIIVADDSATVVKGSHTSGGDEVIDAYTVSELENDSSYKFKLVAEFSDYSLKTEYTQECTLSQHTNALTNWFDTEGQYISKYMEGSSNVNISPTMEANIDDTVSRNGKASVHIASNQAYEYGSGISVRWYYDTVADTAEKTVEKYKASFWLKGSNVHAISMVSKRIGGSQWIVARGKEADYSEWTVINYDLQPTTAAENCMTISVTGIVGDLWVDDVEIYPVYTDGSVGSNVARDGGAEFTYKNTVLVSDVTGLVSSGGDGTADVSWVAATGAEKTRVYMKNDEYTTLRAELSGEATSVEIGDLAYGEEYEIIVKTVNAAGIESVGKSVKVTCVPPDYVVSDFILSSGERITEGNVSVSVDIKNNSVEDGVTVELILALYDGDKLVKAEFTTPQTIAKTAYGAQATTVTDAIEVPALEGGVYTVKAFLWQSLEEMVPYGPSKTFTE